METRVLIGIPRQSTVGNMGMPSELTSITGSFETPGSVGIIVVVGFRAVQNDESKQVCNDEMRMVTDMGEIS
jgi:hypothetical protein